MTPIAGTLLHRVTSPLWIGGVLLALACKESPPQAPPVESATAAVPVPSSTSSVEAPAPAPTTSAAIAEPEPEPVAAAGQKDDPGKVLITGCLVAPKGMPERGAPPPNAKLPKVEVKNGDVPRVVHHLDHACCLSATTDVKVEGSSVIFTEHLSGTPCRCRCSSTIQADLNVAPGDYTLRVITEQDGKTEEAFSGPVHSGAEAPKAKPQLPKHIRVPAAGE